MRQPIEKQSLESLHRELRIRYKEFFESKLAIHFLKHAKFFSVNKISLAIIKLIESNKETVMKSIRDNPSIVAELREPYFGSCYDSKEEVTPDEALEKIFAILKNEDSDLSNIMQVHCIFIHRMYDQFLEKKEKNEFVAQLVPSALFNKESRSRIEIGKEELKSTVQLGISRNPVFNKKLEKSSKNHLRAMEKFKPDYSAAFFKQSLEKEIPVVCGPSGHTGSLMLGAKLYGNLSTEELQEYALASFVFLSAGGNHSFHEVMLVANQIGVEYQEGGYAKSISLTIREGDVCEELKREFPEFLSFDK